MQKVFWFEYDLDDKGRQREEFKNLKSFRKSFKYTKLCCDVKNIVVGCINCDKPIKMKLKKFADIHHDKNGKTFVLKGKDYRFQDEFCSDKCRDEIMKK